MQGPVARTFSRRGLVQIAAVLALVYLIIQLIYLWRLPLVMDEFDGANEAYQLLSRTPYKDFKPYKTVLGYYLEIPPLLLTGDPWTGLILSKAWLALINTAAIFTATLCLSATFTPGAALLGQALLISVSTFLERSSELRVDMLTAWVGLASFLLLLNRRWLLAGVVGGLSFLVSQKGIYYILSADIACVACWLFASRDRRGFRDLVLFNVGVATSVAAYVVLWGAISTPWIVISATFLSHRDIVFGQLYDLRGHWVRTLTRNPFFYLGAGAGIVALLVAWTRNRVDHKHALTAVYGAGLFAMCLWHAQPWPYFFVILIPTLMVVHVASADLFLRHARLSRILVPLVMVVGVAAPFAYMPGILARDNSYQRHVIQLTRALLADGETYLAGNDLVYNDREQAHQALRRLSMPNLRAMRDWPQERLDALVAELEVARPKLIIEDYRIEGLPDAVRDYLTTRFAPLWSSVNTYAPLVSADDRVFNIWFDGEYTVESGEGGAVIDGMRVLPGNAVTLQRGQHQNQSPSTVRLRLVPRGIEHHRIPEMQAKRPMFAGVYSY